MPRRCERRVNAAHDRESVAALPQRNRKHIDFRRSSNGTMLARINRHESFECETDYGRGAGRS